MPRTAEVAAAGELGRELTQTFGDAGVFGEKPFDLRARDRKATNVGFRPHTGRALDVVAEQRTLAEDVSRPDISLALGCLDDGLSLFEHEHARARPAPFDQRLACGRVELRRRGGKAFKLSVVDICEERERAKAVSHYSPSPGNPNPPSAPPASPPSFDSVRL